MKGHIETTPSPEGSPRKKRKIQQTILSAFSASVGTTKTAVSKSNENKNSSKREAKTKGKARRKASKIWLNGNFVTRPPYVTSYGILFYRKVPCENRVNENYPMDGFNGDKKHIEQGNISHSCSDDHIESSQKDHGYEYLLGLIPQGNSWTVFKGLPESDERPEETAIREFEEESSLDFPYSRDALERDNSTLVDGELYGVTSTKKLLQIFLIPAPPEMDISTFNIEKVVKIDKGRFAGVPEIVEIRFLTKQQAIKGLCGRGKTKIAKIYKSQIPILERAEALLNRKVQDAARK